MRIAITLFTLALALAGAPAHAQKWPENPVRMVPAYPAGDRLGHLAAAGSGPGRAPANGLTGRASGQ